LVLFEMLLCSDNVLGKLNTKFTFIYSCECNEKNMFLIYMPTVTSMHS